MEVAFRRQQLRQEPLDHVDGMKQLESIYLPVSLYSTIIPALARRPYLQNPTQNHQDTPRLENRLLSRKALFLRSRLPGQDSWNRDCYTILP